MSIVKSLSGGDGDMFYIKHNSDSFTMIDCCMDETTGGRIVKELKTESAETGIVRFISTHPDDDHIGGITYLHEKMPIVNFYCVKNEATKEDQSDDFDQYCALRDDPKKAFYLQRGCTRKWLNESDQERDGAGMSILWPVTDNKKYQEALNAAADGESPNNISAIIQYTLNGGATVLWMGDLETGFMESVELIPVGRAEILFAPHHGRQTGKVPEEWLNVIRPKLVVIGEAPSKDLDYYKGYNTITQNSAGDITFDCVSGKVRIYVSLDGYWVDFLENEGLEDSYGTYVGTLNI